MGGWHPNSCHLVWMGCPTASCCSLVNSGSSANLLAFTALPRPLQRRRIEQLTALGFQVYVLDSKEQIGEIMDEVQAL